MNKRTAALGAIGLGLAAISEWMRRNGNADRVEQRHTMPAAPDAVINLVRQVWREPEFIPGVVRVDVLDTAPDSVRYRVHFAGGAFAVYCKTWQGDRIAWNSEDGTLGLVQTGMMRLTPENGVTHVHLTVQTAFDAPVVGTVAAAGSHLYAAPAFRAWLVNLGRELARSAPPA